MPWNQIMALIIVGKSGTLPSSNSVKSWKWIQLLQTELYYPELLREINLELLSVMSETISTGSD